MLKTSYVSHAFCSYPFQRLKFTPEGDVTICCFHERKCLGNILKNSLENIWFSPLANNIRESTLQGVLHKTCQIESCPFFLTNNLENQEFECYRYPIEFEIDFPNQHCNIGGNNPSAKNPACLMCERNLKTAEELYQEDKLEEVSQKLKPYIKYIRWLHIQGVAEAFWKDRIFELIDWLGVNKFKHRILISATTNGTLMNASCRGKFLKYPKSGLTWSLDAGSPETYKIIRRVNMYDKIVENLKAYSKERNLDGQYIHIHNNINTINIDEVEKMVELAAEVGVDRLDFNPTYSLRGICVNKENVHLFRNAQIRIMRRAHELGVNATFMRNLTLNLGDPPTLKEALNVL